MKKKKGDEMKVCDLLSFQVTRGLSDSDKYGLGEKVSFM